MNFEFKLPDIGEGLVEGELVKWFVKVGETVSEHQPLASVLTDKAEVEIPSPKAGKIVTLLGKPGEKIQVHAPLAVLDVAGGGSASAVAASSAPETAHDAGGEFVFLLPDIGEGLAEGELVKWHVNIGDAVTEHQPVASVLTDKAEVEVPSPKSGKIAALHGKPGDKVQVHNPLITLSGVAGAAAKAPAAAALAPKPVAPARTASRPSEALAAPYVRQLAKDKGIDISLIAGSGPGGRVLENDVKNFRDGSSPSSPSGAPVNATPAVRSLAAWFGVDLTRLKGTGPGGRIVEGDVRKASPKADRRKPGDKTLSAEGPFAFTPAASPSQGEDAIPFVGIRRKIADKMAHSKRTVAHVTQMDECDMTALLALRDQLKPVSTAKGVKLTFLPFVIKALTKALAQFPGFNSTLNEEAGEIVQKRYYNIGIAVAAPQGLVVPNIKGADGKDLFGLAAEVNALAEKVRANKIDVAALQGGTFTITNIGAVGGLFATPIVNHPEVAILGLMKLQKRPVARDGGIAIREMMNLVLSFDHRVVDGADAAQFLNTVIKYLENPRTLI